MKPEELSQLVAEHRPKLETFCGGRFDYAKRRISEIEKLETLSGGRVFGTTKKRRKRCCGRLPITSRGWKPIAKLRRRWGIWTRLRELAAESPDEFPDENDLDNEAEEIRAGSLTIWKRARCLRTRTTRAARLFIFIPVQVERNLRTGLRCCSGCT